MTDSTGNTLPIPAIHAWFRPRKSANRRYRAGFILRRWTGWNVSWPKRPVH